MSAGTDEPKGSPADDGAHRQDTAKRRYRRWTDEDAKRWKAAYEGGRSIEEIAKEEEVDQKIVSQRLHNLGVEVFQGKHRVKQSPLKLPAELVELLSNGPDHVLKFLDERVWGITATESGTEQLGKFCKFIELHKKGIGVEDIASQAEVHRSTVAEWRNGTDQPYLVSVAKAMLSLERKDGWKALPLHLDSGGNEQDKWILVPTLIQSDSDFDAILQQITPTPDAQARAESLGLTLTPQLRLGLFAYLVGICVGDAGKTSSSEQRFASMSIDLQFTMKHESNQNLGELVCLAANLIGIKMDRISDKHPTGYTRISKNPTDAYRWSSERSPLIAWIVRHCLGLERGKTTSHEPVRMDWIFKMSEEFRKRFIQGVADSDGTVRPYVVEITSTPNTELVTSILHSLGLASAYSRKENEVLLRSVVKNLEASRLPIFNEFTKGYRYQQLMSYTRK